MSEERRGAYAPPVDGDDYDDEGGGRRRGAILLAVAVIVLIAFAGVIWSAYNQGVREGGRDAPPRIAADERPFKTVPADPGGYETPDQDKLVYDEISGQPREVEENVSPPAEEPIEMESLPPAGTESETPDEAPDGLRGDPPAETDAPAEATEPEETPAAPVEEEPEPEPEPEAPAETASASSLVPASADGPWLVQIAATRSNEDAQAVWQGFRNKAADLTNGVRPDYQRADLGERGVYIRVRVPGFQSKGAADAWCAEAKTRGQDCISVAR